MLRLTGGRFKGITLETPAHLRTRPTQSKLRQALFNSLQTHVTESRVLDLFAGSGALGFEALSRGAKEVVFVDESKSACQTIQKNVAILGVEDQVSLLKISMEMTGPSIGLDQLKTFEPFDIILADPPYEQGWELRLLSLFPWDELLKPEGKFCLEWAYHSRSHVQDLPERFPFLVKVRQKNYGNSVLSTYEKQSREQGQEQK